MTQTKIQSKTCTKCKLDKSVDAFYWHSQRKHYIPACKECISQAGKKNFSENREKRNKQNQEWRRANPERSQVIKARTNGIKITWEQFSELKTLQDNKCALCQKELEKFHIDHCHDSGEVRGLLCPTCNWGLGLLGDTEETIERALNYLRKLKERDVQS